MRLFYRTLIIHGHSWFSGSFERISFSDRCVNHHARVRETEKGGLDTSAERTLKRHCAIAC